jgi:hypothetical protein
VYAAYDSQSQAVYFTEQLDSSVWIIKNNSLAGSVSAPYNYSLSAMKGLSVDNQSGNAYVLNIAPGGNTCCRAWFTEISGQSFAGPPVGEFGVTTDIVFDPQSGYAYFGTGGGGACTANPNGLQVVHSDNISEDLSFIPIGPQPPNNDCNPRAPFTPTSLAYASSTGTIYVATQPNLSVTTFFEAKGEMLQSGNFNLTGDNLGLVYDPANQYLYSEELLNPTYNQQGNLTGGSFEVYAIDTSTNTIVNSTTVPFQSVLLYDSSNKYVYAFGQGSIAVISGTKVVANYPEPTNLEVLEAAYDPASNEMIAFEAPQSSTSTTTSITTATATTTSSSTDYSPLALYPISSYSQNSNRLLSVDGTQYADGRFWAYYSVNQSLYYSSSVDGKNWNPAATVGISINNNSSAMLASSPPAVWIQGTVANFAFANYSTTTTTLFYESGEANPSGSIAWAPAEEIYLTPSQTVIGGENYSVNVSPISVRTDSSGDPWVAFRVTFNPEAGGYGLVQYYIAKSATGGGAFTMAAGFPYNVGSWSEHDYGFSQVALAPLASGSMGIAVCQIQSTQNASVSSYVQTWNTSAGWGERYPFPLGCGFNFSTLQGIFDTSSSNNTMRMGYYWADVRCDACQMQNENESILSYSFPSGAVSEERILTNVTQGDEGVWGVSSGFNGEVYVLLGNQSGTYLTMGNMSSVNQFSWSPPTLVSRASLSGVQTTYQAAPNEEIGVVFSTSYDGETEIVYSLVSVLR